jgi:hypothetical protein
LCRGHFLLNPIFGRPISIDNRKHWKSPRHELRAVATCSLPYRPTLLLIPTRCASDPFLKQDDKQDDVNHRENVNEGFGNDVVHRCFYSMPSAISRQPSAKKLSVGISSFFCLLMADN